MTTQRKILLVDTDSKDGFPNLALMKLSAHHKRLGDTIDLIKGIPTAPPLEEYDITYLSCIFFQNAGRVRDYANQIKSKGLILGGSGFLPYDVRLGSEIEHILPDYDLYGVDFSMGFTSRGCIRNCEWCIVPKKEGKIRDNAPVSEFHDLRYNKIILLDNNFQASPKWRENLEYIIDHNLKVNFCQGLDARLVNEEFASMLSLSKCYDWAFNVRGAYLAFDTPQMEKPLLRALKTFENAGMPPKSFIVYVLVGFDTSYKDDLKRIDTIIEAGAKPYIMLYNRSPDSTLRHLARFYNRKYYEFVKRDEYKEGVLQTAES